MVYVVMFDGGNYQMSARVSSRNATEALFAALGKLKLPHDRFRVSIKAVEFATRKDD